MFFLSFCLQTSSSPERGKEEGSEERGGEKEGEGEKEWACAVNLTLTRNALSLASFYEVAVGSPSEVHYSWRNSRRPPHNLAEVTEARSEEDWKDTDDPRATLKESGEVLSHNVIIDQRFPPLGFLVLLDDMRLIAELFFKTLRSHKLALIRREFNSSRLF